MRLNFLIFLVIAYLAIALSGCDRDSPESRSNGKDSDGVLFALLADNHLLKISVDTGKVLAERPLGTPPSTPATGRYLGLDAQKRTLFVLVPGQETSSIRVIDIATMKVRARIQLPDRIEARGLAVGPTSGRLYVVANLPGRRFVEEGFDVHERSVEVIVLEPDGRTVARAEVRKADGHDWLVYRVAMSVDEQSLYVSYHGLDTSGADHIAVLDGALAGCGTSGHGHLGCFPHVHGSVEPVNDRVVSSTGSRVVIAIGRTGDVEQTWTTALKSAHLMELAVTPDRTAVYALGSCAQGGGLSAIRFDVDRVDDVVPPESNLFVCGERLAAGAESMAFVGESAGPSLVGVGSLLFVDVRSGRVVRRLPTSFAATDLIAVTHG